MSPELRLDLHVHSRWSPDSTLDLPAIAVAIRRAGLNGFALTDHNTVAGHGPLRALAAEHPELVLVPGVEVSTADGHLLGYGLDAAPPPRRPLPETIDWIADRGGVAVVAHPFRWTHGVGRRLRSRVGVAAVETMNGQSSARTNRRASRLADGRGLGATGGSDAHTPDGIGRAFTVFPEPVGSLNEALRALHAGSTRSGGASLGRAGQLRWVVRNLRARVGRGLRPV